MEILICGGNRRGTWWEDVFVQTLGPYCSIYFSYCSYFVQILVHVIHLRYEVYQNWPSTWTWMWLRAFFRNIQSIRLSIFLLQLTDRLQKPLIVLRIISHCEAAQSTARFNFADPGKGLLQFIGALPTARRTFSYFMSSGRNDAFNVSSKCQNGKHADYTINFSSSFASICCKVGVSAELRLGSDSAISRSKFLSWIKGDLQSPTVPPAPPPDSFLNYIT